MSLASGSLTTPEIVATWLANPPTLPSAIINQLITSMSNVILGKLNRSRSLNRNTHQRVFDGLGNMQIVLPDWPVISITSVQQGQSLIPPSILPTPGQPQPTGSNPCYGYRFIPWRGNLPGEQAVLEFVGGYFYTAPQNVIVTYDAGYGASGTYTIPAATPWQIIVDQGRGIWSLDNGVTYTDGTPLVAVAATPGLGQYISPVDATPGLYTFSTADAGTPVIITYSFIPADLTEACNQMVAERLSYRGRIGEISKSLGGQETIRYLRGGSKIPGMAGLPPEVADMIWPYVSVISPAIGAPT